MTRTAMHSEPEKDEDGTLVDTRRRLENGLAAIGYSELVETKNRDCHKGVKRESVNIGSTQEKCHSKSRCCSDMPHTSSSCIGMETHGAVSAQTNGSVCQNQIVAEGDSYCEDSDGENAGCTESNTGDLKEESYQTRNIQDLFSDQGCIQGLVSASCSDCCPSDQVTTQTAKSRHNDASGGDPQACDLSYIYLDILIQSDELSVNPDSCRLTVTSNNIGDIDPQQTDLSLMPESNFTPTSGGNQTTSVLQQSANDGENISTGKCETQIDSPDKCRWGNIRVLGAASSLEFLSLSGCYRITGDGISALSEPPGMPCLKHLDLSGCVNVSGESLHSLVMTAPGLDHANLFYCDNLPEDPFPTTASGCRNRECCNGSLYCCSLAG
ncbi:hypothetical protein EGW08_018711 [Elysia chlorotica]|uniref:Uncharacterized protein n=1 Tax=Elysia chlorotica TaxID=188477 RepID=A0A3S0ZAX3_ELYCH|nr:hypothetical protein EGW08_018711 [Elysia chlorotica]